MLASLVMAVVLPAIAVVPAYPGSRLESPPSVRLRSDGSRSVVSRLATADPIAVVRRRCVNELGAGRVLSSVDDGQRAVVVIGPALGQPTIVAWRDAGDPETHLLIERRIGQAVPTSAMPSELARALRPATMEVDGLPVYPLSRPESERQHAVGRTYETIFTTEQPFAAVAEFYRMQVAGPAIEAHAGGTDWLEITSSAPDHPSVHLLREPGSATTRITFYPRTGRARD